MAAARVRAPSPVTRGLAIWRREREHPRMFFRKALAPLGSVCASVGSWLRVGRVATGGHLGDHWGFA
eukprot:1624007-Pyramimonas_sp.AAC.1